MRKRPRTPEELAEKRAKNRLFMKGYYQRNKEKILLANKTYRETNKDKFIEYQKKYELTHPERVKTSKRRWDKENPEKKQAWAVQNRQKSNEIKAQYKKRHPEEKLKQLLRSRIVLALNSQGVRKNKKTIEMLGCSIDALKVHLESKFTEGMTWQNRGYWGWHIDHIKPLSLFDLYDSEEQRTAFHYTNLQPLWAKDNFSRKTNMRFELQQTVYSYWLDNKSSEYWTGTSVMQYKDIKKDTLDNLRAYDEARKHMHAPVIKNAGWHFTNLGGAEFVKRKIRSYAHAEFNTPEFLAQVDRRVAMNQDYLGRPFTFETDESGWPTYLKKNRTQWAHLCRGVGIKVNRRPGVMPEED